MRPNRLLLCAFASVAVLLTAHFSRFLSQSVNSSSPPVSPAVAPLRPVTDVYYGTKVVDPYRYMENLKDPEVEAWMKSQNDYTRSVLATFPAAIHCWRASAYSTSRFRESARATARGYLPRLEASSHGNV